MLAPRQFLGCALNPASHPTRWTPERWALRCAARFAATCFRLSASGGGSCTTKSQAVGKSTSLTPCPKLSLPAAAEILFARQGAAPSATKALSTSRASLKERPERHCRASLKERPLLDSNGTASGIRSRPLTPFPPWLVENIGAEAPRSAELIAATCVRRSSSRGGQDYLAPEKLIRKQGPSPPPAFDFFFFITLDLELSDTKVCEP